MTIALSNVSRYDRRTYVEHTHVDGSKRYVWDLKDPITKSALDPESWTIHVVRQGEALDALAFEYLGDVRLWWVIADLNRDVLEDTLRIDPGTQLVVPVGSITMQGIG